VRDVKAKRLRKVVGRARSFARRAAGAPGKPGKREREDATKAEPRLVRHFIAPELWRAYEAVLAYERRLPADAAVAHRIRAAARRLRYVIELWEGALSGGAASRAKELHALQDRLGDLHDDVVALERIREGIARGALRDTKAVRGYLRHRRAARDRRLAAVPASWRTLAGARLRGAIASASIECARTPRRRAAQSNGETRRAAPSRT
jgi:CHAD domain-containing protein